VYFHVYAWTDESKSIPRRLQSWCQTCQRLHVRIKGGHKPRANKIGVKTGDNGYEPQTPAEWERYREYQRERYAGWTDEKKEDRREYQRIMLEAKRREAGVKPRALKRYESKLPQRNVYSVIDEPQLPSKPLGDWLKSQLRFMSISEIGVRGRVNKEKLEEIMAGEIDIGLELADRLLTGLDCVEQLYVLYPQED